MEDTKQLHADTKKRGKAVAMLTLLLLGGGFAKLPTRAATSKAGAKEKQVATTQSKFFCNTKALTAGERARHKELTEKLLAIRKANLETEKGYEFQFSPKDISIKELAEWVVVESKCCPFFDFHIDLEQSGSLLCLRLTGEEGIKAFIRSEFSLR